MVDVDSDGSDDFNPILDDLEDDSFEGFDELQVEHSVDTQSRDVARAEAVESDELSFAGFKEKLPEVQSVPRDVQANSEASRAFRGAANARREETNAKAKVVKGASSSSKRESVSSDRAVYVDEDLEKAIPFLESIEPRVRSTDVSGSGRSQVGESESGSDDSLSAGGSESFTGSESSGGRVSDEAVSDSVSESDLTPGEKWSGERKVKRYRYAGANGLLNGAELEFFRENETSRRAVLLGDNSLDYLRPGLGVEEGDEERKKRIEKVTQAVFGRDAFRRNSKKRWGRKHQEFLEFLAKFKYATPRHLSKMFSESPVTSQKRLKELRSYGLVIDKKILGGEPLWFLTDAGMLLSGYDMVKVTESRITYTMLPHQYAVNHIAANLWGAGVNVLNEDEYPLLNRIDLLGKEQYGDNVVSEQEIQSSFGKLKLFSKADVYLPTLKASIERKTNKWKELGGVEFGPSPEFQQGNEYMWAIFPPAVVKLAYHVPDLVVARPRNADGSPNSVAVELEIQNKPIESYRKALTAYRYATHTYKQVVWVCQKSSSAKKIRDLASEMGMLKSGALRIVPIVTQDGIFKGRDLWTL